MKLKEILLLSVSMMVLSIIGKAEKSDGLCSEKNENLPEEVINACNDYTDLCQNAYETKELIPEEYIKQILDLVDLGDFLKPRAKDVPKEKNREKQEEKSLKELKKWLKNSDTDFSKGFEKLSSSQKEEFIDVFKNFLYHLKLKGTDWKKSTSEQRKSYVENTSKTLILTDIKGREVENSNNAEITLNFRYLSFKEYVPSTSIQELLQKLLLNFLEQTKEKKKGSSETLVSYNECKTLTEELLYLEKVIKNSFKRIPDENVLRVLSSLKTKKEYKKIEARISTNPKDLLKNKKVIEDLKKENGFYSVSMNYLLTSLEDGGENKFENDFFMKNFSETKKRLKRIKDNIVLFYEKEAVLLSADSMVRLDAEIDKDIKFLEGAIKKSEKLCEEYFQKLNIIVREYEVFLRQKEEREKERRVEQFRKMGMKERTEKLEQYSKIIGSCEKVLKDIETEKQRNENKIQNELKIPENFTPRSYIEKVLHNAKFGSPLMVRFMRENKERYVYEYKEKDQWGQSIITYDLKPNIEYDFGERYRKFLEQNISIASNLNELKERNVDLENSYSALKLMPDFKEAKELNKKKSDLKKRAFELKTQIEFMILQEEAHIVLKNIETSLEKNKNKINASLHSSKNTIKKELQLFKLYPDAIEPLLLGKNKGYSYLEKLFRDEYMAESLDEDGQILSSRDLKKKVKNFLEAFETYLKENSSLEHMQDMVDILMELDEFKNELDTLKQRKGIEKMKEEFSRIESLFEKIEVLEKQIGDKYPKSFEIFEQKN